MSALKDLVDLAAQLSQSITDRKTRELLLPLKELVTEAKEENFRLTTAHAEEVAALKAKAFEANRHHADEMATLKSHYEQVMRDLKAENAKLVATIHRLETPDQQLTLDDTKTAILVFLGDGHNHLSWEVSEHLKISEQRALFHLNELDSMTPQLIHCQANATPDIPTTYSISHHGRGYLVKQGLPI